MLRPSRVIALACVALSFAARAAEPPDRIYVNALVWTGEPSQPAAEALAVSGDRFVAVGTDKDVRGLAGPRTAVTDLKGLRVVPGFNDAHWHLPSRRGARLDGAGSVEVIQRRLVDYSRTLPAGSWVVGRGWMPTDFPNRTADRRYLDAVFPDRPVVIRDRDGHQALANTPALELAGITRDTPAPPDGWIEHGPGGEPTGLLKEAAASLVTGLLPPLTTDETYELLLEELATAASFGLTSLQDPTDVGFTQIERAAIMRAVEMGTMTVRYRVPLPLEIGLPSEQIAAYAVLRDSTRDALVMIEPYVGGGNGVPMLSQPDLDRAVADFDRAGLQVEIHAIGDGAIRMALDAYEHAAKVNGPRDRRHRIEHVEVPAAADVARFRALGVIVSTQPIGATPDVVTLENYAPLLGPERFARAYDPKQFDDAGAIQAFGSDYPVYSMDPLAGIYAVVTRQTRDGTPAGGSHPENRITVEAALRHYTRDAAYASFDEARKGSIAVGKYADFVVLSDDILAMAPQKLLQVKVLLTVMGGRETYRASGLDDSSAR